MNGTAPTARSAGFLKHVNATVDMLGRTTPMRLFWAREYSDYHPELPGGRATGRTCECRPLNARVLGKYRDRLRGGVMEVKVADHHYLAPPHYGIWLPPDLEHVGLNRLEVHHCSLYVARAGCAVLPAASAQA